MLEHLGTIAFSDLISDTKIPGVLKKQFVTADHFINLMSLAELASTKKTPLSNGRFVTHIDLLASLKDRIYPPKADGQEPGDN